MAKRLTTAFFCVLMLSIASACGGEGQGTRTADGTRSDPGSTASEIRDVLETQAEAWNQGSIRGFMAGYARTDTLRFASGGRVWTGWNQTLQRYRETYPDEGMMGRLSFTDVEIWPTSDDHAVAFGRWELSRSEMYENVGGLFTLVFERSPEGWRIVHDHTSSRQTIQSQQPDTVDAQQDNAE